MGYVWHSRLLRQGALRNLSWTVCADWNTGVMIPRGSHFTKVANFPSPGKRAGLRTWPMLFGEQVLRPPWDRTYLDGYSWFGDRFQYPPHRSHDGKFVMVHNGVIENFGTLKRFLEGKGISFSSETDSEVLCNLIAYHYSELPEDEDRFVDAVRLALPKCRGAYGIAVFVPRLSDAMIGARRGSPLVVGLGEDANFIASDASAFRWPSQEAVFLNDGELAVLDKGGFRITTLEGQDAQAVTHPRPDSWRSSLGISIPTWKKKFSNSLPLWRIPCG